MEVTNMEQPQTFNIKEIAEKAGLGNSPRAFDVDVPLPQCCDSPTATFTEMVGGCCGIIYCDNCRLLWHTSLTPGHTIDDHRSKEQRHADLPKEKANRRRKRKKMRKRQWNSSTEEE